MKLFSVNYESLLPPTLILELLNIISILQLSVLANEIQEAQGTFNFNGDIDWSFLVSFVFLLLSIVFFYLCVRVLSRFNEHLLNEDNGIVTWPKYFACITISINEKNEDGLILSWGLPVFWFSLLCYFFVEPYLKCWGCLLTIIIVITDIVLSLLFFKIVKQRYRFRLAIGLLIFFSVFIVSVWPIYKHLCNS